MRPRERYTRDGPAEFGDVELVALILGTGTPSRSVRQIAAALLDRFDGLGGLARAHPTEIAGEGGVGIVKAIRLHAGFESGRRALREPRPTEPIRCATDAWRFLAPGFHGLVAEELHALYLDRLRRPLGYRVLTRGNDGCTVVDPRQVFRPAVSLGAPSLVLAHNHPSGDPTPSPQDKDVTRRVFAAGRVLGVALVDHLVMGHRTFASLAEAGELPQWNHETVQMTGEG